MAISEFRKLFLTSLIFLGCFKTNSQTLLETSKLTTFNQNGLSLTAAQIKTADSILINAVNYYNARTAREYELVCLSDSAWAVFRRIDSVRKLYLPYVSESGKIKKTKLSKLDNDNKKYISKLIEERSFYDSVFFNTLLKEKRNCNDSVVLVWGSGEKIDIKNYFRQYTFNFNSDGSVFIRAACFCSDMLKNSKIDWKKFPIKINDGGSCFFTINIDLKNKTGSMMKVN